MKKIKKIEKFDVEKTLSVGRQIDQAVLEENKELQIKKILRSIGQSHKK